MLAPSAEAAGLEPSTDFNLGTAGDYRIPDAGLLLPSSQGVYVPTVPLVVEIVAPGDETWQKVPFYAAHRVAELLSVDPRRHSVQWLALEQAEYQPIERSGLIDLGPAELAARIDWSAIDHH